MRIHYIIDELSDLADALIPQLTNINTPKHIINY